MKATGVLGRLAVEKAARGTGLGKLLVREIERRAMGRGLAVIELHAQTHARRFYCPESLKTLQVVGLACAEPEADSAGSV
jgi:GNAT superfamily N-acetyltransferase